MGKFWDLLTGWKNNHQVTVNDIEKNDGVNEGINEGISLLLLTIQKYEGKRSGYLSKIIYIPQKTIAVVVYFKN